MYTKRYLLRTLEKLNKILRTCKDDHVFQYDEDIGIICSTDVTGCIQQVDEGLKSILLEFFDINGIIIKWISKNSCIVLSIDESKVYC